jgi:nucleotidyltransferase/DNA polymerase involved in DNA repair
MVRLACVNVGNLPLQLLYKKHPKWREFPAAVVSKDSPYATILSVNSRAGEYGIETGLRYAGALSLNHELRADTVSDETVAEGVSFLAGKLGGYSPQVESDRLEPGIYWLDACGMTSLYPDFQVWCSAVRHCLAECGFAASIAAGFTRFGCYAAAKSIEDQMIFPHQEAERRRALETRISVLKLPVEALERLEMLDVRTVGSFLELQPGAVGKRFGPEVRRLHRFVSGQPDLPPRQADTRVDPQRVINLPCAEYSSVRLMEAIVRSLEDVIGQLRKSHRLMRELRLCFVLEGNARNAYYLEPVVPSTPTVDIHLLTDLIALRMENLRLSAAAVAIRMSAVTIVERNIQPELFNAASRESRKEVDKVFARLRGIFGNGCVQRARLEDEHMPERSYSWEDLERMPREPEQGPAAPTSKGGPAEPAVPRAARQAAPEGRAVQARRTVRVRRAVRRIFAEPCPLPRVKLAERWGPYPISGRWWWGEQSRQYGYGETGTGEILWLCRDGSDDQWRQIGVLE